MSTSTTPAVLVPAKALDYQNRCPVCDGAEILRGYDLKEFEVLRCASCQTAWRSNMYTPEQVAAMYEDEPYEEHPFFGYDSDAETLRKVPRFRRFQQGLKVVEREVGVGRLLDVGCGAFEALDPEDAKYDVITLWDVIEHVLDPVSFIERAQRMLRPGGVIVICTPDEESVLANTGKTILSVSGGRWNYPALALHPRYHTFFFSGTSLENLFTARGMNVVESYSQAAFAAHSELASRAQKIVIGMIERVAGLRDRRYERVIFARTAE
jgi:SAM-dependent methyltransferase